MQNAAEPVLPAYVRIGDSPWMRSGMDATGQMRVRMERIVDGRPGRFRRQNTFHPYAKSPDHPRGIPSLAPDAAQLLS
ncbi:hypothetical protein BKM31_55450 [[Actinomadura] parvosata subsp. kistnae]|uniref:Uncharacterized protein n=1 Tax=[Actinomadura] parvosata subsp. kistnae TaxID=1909395 RepID=A0A1V0AGV5_9ACTN|nr:hypothetical protein BKM31_55450 [Nonomuraea sp. ATCC 55076]